MRKYKKYMLLLLTVIFMFALSGVALAADDMQTITKNGVTYEFPDVKNIDGATDDYIIFNRNNKKAGIENLCVLFGKWYYVDNYYNLKTFITSDGSAFARMLGDGRWWIDPCSKKSEDSGWKYYTYADNVADFEYTILYSTYDIKYATSIDSVNSVTDEVFFKAPPVGQLKMIVKRINLGGALSEVVSLMPLVLLAVTSYLALRKAYSFVLMQLRKS